MGGRSSSQAAMNSGKGKRRGTTGSLMAEGSPNRGNRGKNGRHAASGRGRGNGKGNGRGKAKGRGGSNGGGELELVIAPGAHIELRDAVWRVVRVDSTSTGGKAWRCVGVSEIVRDQETVFLEELEPKVKVLDPRVTELARDVSSMHQAGLLYIESLLRDVPPTHPRVCVGHKAAMDLLYFQLQPSAKALQKPRQRILIADGVGLGKTMEAGILLSELIRRGRGRRILVATTKAMLTQFQKEMWGRFAIPLVRLDSVGLQRIRADIPTHHNPFYYFDKSIISIDTLKQNNWFRTHVEQAFWDVIVIDEAHNVAVRKGGRSQRARIASTLAGRCDSLILLSATPHDGSARSFASLMNMLDPTAIADPDNYGKDDIQGLFVRRFKTHVADQLAKKIPERIISKARVQASPAEEQAFEMLATMKFSRLDQRKTKGSMLFRTTLEKALFSSPQACAKTARNRIRRLTAPSAKGSKAQDSKAHKDAQTSADVALLEALADHLEAIGPQQFSRYQRLLEIVKKQWKWSPRAKNDRIVIFTERRETQGFLYQHLQKDLKLKPEQIDILHGTLSDEDQMALVERFGQEKDKLRVLVTTDVASEGLNLHYQCHRLIHFDIPWSLMVFQQRNGRIDRYGQTQQPLIVYLLNESAVDDIGGDLRILELLIEKDRQAHENIGDPTAFMNVCDIEEEELITGEAMESKRGPEALDTRMQEALMDPFLMKLEQAAQDTSTEHTAPAIQELSSLFSSDFDFIASALKHLQGQKEVKAKIRAKDQLIELEPPDDLQYRQRRWPKEVVDDGEPMLLTADPLRMTQAIDEARREEKAWPQHQYLWGLHPVVEWVKDRMRAAFGRHTAPVLDVGDLLGPHTSAIIISGLLPNRRGQPLVHRWYVARFQNSKLIDLDEFPEFLQNTRFGTKTLPNDNRDLHPTQLQDLLPMAVDAVADHLAVDRKTFVKDTKKQLSKELKRLETLKAQRLEYVATLYGDRRDKLAEARRQSARRQTEKLFQNHSRWAEDSMTVGDAPFIQVIAVLVNGKKVGSK